MRKTAVLFCALTLVSLCAAQKPNISNAKLQELPAASGLKPAFDAIAQKQEAPVWIGYRIPAVPTQGSMCCPNSWSSAKSNGAQCCMGCKMESKEESFTGTISGCAPSEPFHESLVFFRVEARQVTKIRSYSPDCKLDFGGLPVFWLENVSPGQSVALLSELAHAANTESKRSITTSALGAIAMHDDPAADQVLQKLMQPETPESIRELVAFWLGAQRGKRGFEVLHKYAKNDPSDSLRQKIAFALSVSKEPEAIKDLISMARSDTSSRVRGQAIFWLAQIGGRKEAQEITDAIENDPETEVKKRAVFALSQMKNGDGVPLLIQVARTNKNPVVRREAVRWLGFTNDPRALDFLEQILAR
jgi:HEAT repeat protein